MSPKEEKHMRKRLITAFLLVVAAIVLGSTLFREQIVSAATTPFQNVVVTNTSTNPIPVQQVGTSTTSVSGIVGIDSSKNTVNIGSTDSGHLANIDNAVGKLNFDGSGNLETTAQSASPGAVTDACLPDNSDLGGWSVNNDDTFHTICSEDTYVTDITATGMDDNLRLQFSYQGNVVLVIWGSGLDGQASYQMDLTHPIHIDEIQAVCNNGSTHCNFNMAVLGNSSGT
jgi:hypothetical protein